MATDYFNNNKTVVENDVVWHYPDGIFSADVDQHGVAFIHLLVYDKFRGRRHVARILLAGLERLKKGKVRKAVAMLCSNNQLLRVGKRKKFGFELEGILKKQVVVDGKLNDIYLYSKEL